MLEEGSDYHDDAASSVSHLLAKRLYEELHSVVMAVVAGARYGTKIRLPHAFVMTFLFKRDMSTRDKLRSVGRLVVEHATNLASFAAIYKVLLSLLKWTSRHLLLAQSKSASTRSSERADGLFRRLGGTIVSTLLNHPWPGEAQLFQAATAAPPGHPEHSHHALVAGAVGGYLVWGRYSSVNYQIVLYLTSRVLVGLWKRFLARRRRRRQQQRLDSSQGTRTQTTRAEGLGSTLRDRAYPLAAAAVWGIVMMLFEESPEVLHPSLRSSMDEIYRFGLPPREDV